MSRFASQLCSWTVEVPSLPGAPFLAPMSLAAGASAQALLASCHCLGTLARPARACLGRVGCGRDLHSQVTRGGGSSGSTGRVESRPTSAIAGELLPAIPKRLFLHRVTGGVLGLLALGGGFMAFPFTSSARARAGEAEQILKNVEWPEEWPFTSENFERYDQSADTTFYSSPRFVTHIDDKAINALTKYYASIFPRNNTPGCAIMDMCSSWISHYPQGFKQEKVVGMGLNEAELKRNPVLTEYYVQDLNVSPKLPFENNTFDIITNAVSVDYLSKPLDIFKEMHRVLKPGGLAVMSFSNRCFWTKAIQIWTATGDVDHCYIVGAYFHYAGGFEAPQALDISPNPGRTDPMYVVFSRKLKA